MKANIGQQEYPITQHFAARLRSCRKETGLNQADFAALGGVAIGAQQRYEAGAAEPGASYFKGLSAAGIDILWLITATRAGDSLDPVETELISLCRSLSFDFVRAMVTLAQTATGAATRADQVAEPAARRALHDKKIDYRAD